MTSQQIMDAARDNLNAASDSNWSDTNLLVQLYQVMLYVARKTRCIEDTSTDTSVASTATYSLPTNAIEILRVTYAGKKLQQIDLRQLDSINPSGSTSSGTPAYYWVYESIVNLYPTPASSGDTIKYWTVEEPAVPTAASTPEVPSAYHDVLVDGLTFKMCPKDLGHPLTAMFQERFLSGVADIEQHMKRKKRADRFAIVKSEESNLMTDLGMV